MPASSSSSSKLFGTFYGRPSSSLLRFHRSFFTAARRPSRYYAASVSSSSTTVSAGVLGKTSLEPAPVVPVPLPISSVQQCQWRSFSQDASKLNPVQRSHDSLCVQEKGSPVAVEEDIFSLDHFKSLDTLEQASRRFISESSNRTSSSSSGIDVSTLETLLEEWEKALSALDSTHSKKSNKATSSTSSAAAAARKKVHIQAAVERMNDLFQQWLQMLNNSNNQHKSTTTNSRPFEILLTAWSEVVPNGPEALALLETWNSRLGGNLGLAPTREHYHAVLRAFLLAQQQEQDVNEQQKQQEDEGDNNNRRNNSSHDTSPASTSLTMAAHVAADIWIQLQEWGFTMAPNLTTHQLVTSCIAKCLVRRQEIRRSSSSSSSSRSRSSSEETKEGRYNNNDNDDEDYTDPVLMQTLEDAGEQLLEEVLDIHGKFRRDLKGPELVAILQTLCNGLGCCYAAPLMQKKNGKGQYQQQQQQQVLSNWTKWLACLENLLEDNDFRDKLLSQVMASNDSNDILQDLFLATTSVQRLSMRLLQGSERARTATRLLDALETAFPQTGLLPKTQHYHLAIKVWSSLTNQGDDDEDFERTKEEKVRHYLNRMEEAHYRFVDAEHETESHWLVTESWNRLMMAYYEAGHLSRVNKIWKIMVSSRNIRRNNLSFSVILKALAGAGDLHGAKQAHSILKRMVAKERSERHVQPDAQHFGSVMVAWSRSRNAQAGKFCQEIFDTMIKESKEDASLLPTAVHYSALIASWGWQKDDPQAVNRILSLFCEMQESGLEPDSYTYVAVLSALSRTRTVEGAVQAEELLNRLEFSKENVSLSRQYYVSVMYAWANVTTPLAFEKCEAILERLQDAYIRSGRDVSMRPNSLAFRALVNASTESGSNDDNKRQATHRVDELLDRVEAAAATGAADPPDSKLYSSVMAAHWKAGTPEAIANVERVLERMKSSYATGNTSAKPDVWAMTILMHAYAKSNVAYKASIVWDILRQMCDAYEQGDMDMRPTSHAFAAVLNACAYTTSKDKHVKEEAVRIALMAMNELDDGRYDRPNQYTFRNLLQVIGRQVDDLKERTRLASVIFHRCCQEGHVNSLVLREIRENTPGLYAKLPLDSERKNLQLPPHWTRHVRT